MFAGFGIGILHDCIRDLTLDLVPVDLINNATLVAVQTTAARWSNGHKDIKVYTLMGYRNPQTLRKFMNFTNQ